MSACSPASCRKKRDERNCYRTRAEAKRVAKFVTRKTGIRIDPFFCEHCLHWHTGKPAWKE